MFSEGSSIGIIAVSLLVFAGLIMGSFYITKQVFRLFPQIRVAMEKSKAEMPWAYRRILVIIWVLSVALTIGILNLHFALTGKGVLEWFMQ